MRPRWLRKDYVEKVNMYLMDSGLYFVEVENPAERDIIYEIPAVDARSLINSPGLDIADVYRDAVLARLFGFDRLTYSDLLKLLRAYVRAKQSVLDDFMVKLSEGMA